MILFLLVLLIVAAVFGALKVHDLLWLLVVLLVVAAVFQLL